LAKLRRAKRSGKRSTPAVSRDVRISEKDPRLMCGKGTTVARVFRVEERSNDRRVMHVVFLDRHGWYCEHGSECEAVKDVRKFIR
jgi:hypothetical protein